MLGLCPFTVLLESGLSMNECETSHAFFSGHLVSSVRLARVGTASLEFCSCAGKLFPGMEWSSRSYPLRLLNWPCVVLIALPCLGCFGGLGLTTLWRGTRRSPPVLVNCLVVSITISQEKKFAYVVFFVSFIIFGILYSIKKRRIHYIIHFR